MWCELDIQNLPRSALNGTKSHAAAKLVRRFATLVNKSRIYVHSHDKLVLCFHSFAPLEFILINIMVKVNQSHSLPPLVVLFICCDMVYSDGGLWKVFCCNTR